MSADAVITESDSFLPLNYVDNGFKDQANFVMKEIIAESSADSPVEKRLYVPPIPMVPASTRLQKMIYETDELIVCPGVYDGLSARTAHEVGFDALYMVCFDLVLILCENPNA